MTKKKPRLAGKIALFLLIFGIPWGLLFFLSSADHAFQSLPYLGPEEITESGDTLHYTIPEFEFDLHGGGKLTRDDLIGHYTIVSVVSNDCPDHCVIQLYQFWELIYQEITSNDSYDDVIMISEVVDYSDGGPEQPEEVLEFLDYDPKRWLFFTTDYNVLFDFKPRPESPKPIDVPGNPEFGGKEYFKLALLLDKEGHVRGMYRLNHSGWIMELRRGLRLLIKEEVLTTVNEKK